MEDASHRPAVADRYDPYDPRHPMWADRFWGQYCSRSTAPPPAAAAGQSPAEATGR